MLLARLARLALLAVVRTDTRETTRAETRVEIVTATRVVAVVVVIPLAVAPITAPLKGLLELEDRHTKTLLALTRLLAVPATRSLTVRNCNRLNTIYLTGAIRLEWANALRITTRGGGWVRLLEIRLLNFRAVLIARGMRSVRDNVVILGTSVT